MRSKIYITVLILIIFTSVYCSKYYYKHYGSSEEYKQIINNFSVWATVEPNVGTSRKPITESLCHIQLHISSDDPKYDDVSEVFKKFKIDSLFVEIPIVSKTLRIKPMVYYVEKDGITFGFGDHDIPDMAYKIILKFTVVYDDKNGEGFKKDVTMELTKQTGYDKGPAPYLLD